MKKLIAAVVMVAIAATLLATSTFAWFSMNDTVSASGIEISAKADTSLLISTTSAATGFSNTASLTADNGMNSNVVPVTDTLDKTNHVLTFQSLKSDSLKKVQPDGSISSTDAEYQDNTKDFFHDTIWLSYAGDGDATVSMSATIGGTGTVDGIYKAVHVGIVEVGTGGAEDVLHEIEFAATSTDTDFSTSLSLSSGSTVKLEIYVWVDGPDSDCYNDNATNGTALSVDLSFTADVEEED